MHKINTSVGFNKEQSTVKIEVPWLCHSRTKHPQTLKVNMTQKLSQVSKDRKEYVFETFDMQIMENVS